MSVAGPALQELLNAFREHYHCYESSVHEAISNSADAIVLWRLGDDLDEYLGLVNEASLPFYSAIFEATELNVILHNISAMQNDAYSLRSTTGIACFLGVSRTLQQPSTLAVFNNAATRDSAPLDNDGHEYLIDPKQQQQQEVELAPGVSSFTGPLSTITDDDLDSLLILLRRHYCRAGITMFDGMLRCLGHHVSRERIRQTLIRVDPVQRVFQRITIRRRRYHVPGPNSLWHHDGMVWIFFLYNSRSVHNVRIEHLWADVMAQIGATWADIFIILELHQGLDINNANHIWLLHHLFLNQINQQLDFFREAWNQHQIQICDGPNRNPADMFGFDMLVHGVRGTDPLVDGMSPAELEVFGVDWEALHDETLLDSRQDNNPVDEGSTSWIGRRGPPDSLNEISVESPDGLFLRAELEILDASLLGLSGAVQDADVAHLWMEALIVARSMHGDAF
ncbi:hypothetical protein FB451DRAFT_1338260 [Mycena latifolia]|nr:hypothetical protein FB451DRAFT_1338260 [Mycena latifolia]